MSGTYHATGQPGRHSGEPEELVLTPVAAILLGVRACLCETFGIAGVPVCCCMVYPGETRPPMAGCGCECDDGQGVAWVRYLRETEILPTTIRKGFGGACQNTGHLQLSLEAGVYRCVEVPDPDDNSARCDENTADALAREMDKEIVLSVLKCCKALEELNVTVVSTGMIGPSGGCAGAFATVTVDLRS